MRYIIYLLYFIAGVFLGMAILENANASQQIRIAIIDTGYSPEYAKKIHAEPLKLCPGDNNIDYTRPQDGFNQTHGTIVASIIANKLKNVDYCAVVYKVFGAGHFQPTAYTIYAMLDAAHKNVMAVNMSFTGRSAFDSEFEALKHLSDKGTLLFAAAGNDGRDLSKKCNVFPVCYLISGIRPVQSIDRLGRRCMVSNYSRDFLAELGTGYGDEEDACATSYATPRALAEFVLRFSRLLALPPTQITQPKQLKPHGVPTIATKALTQI